MSRRADSLLNSNQAITCKSLQLNSIRFKRSDELALYYSDLRAKWKVSLKGKKKLKVKYAKSTKSVLNYLRAFNL